MLKHSRIGTPEVAQLIWNVSSIYSPELKVGWTAVGYAVAVIGAW